MLSAHSATSFANNPSVLADILQYSPNGVIAYQAIRDRSDSPINGQILDYCTIYFNPQLTTITGYTPAELTGQLLFQRAPYVRARFEQLRLVVDQQEPHDYQYFNERTGRWIAVQNRPLGDGFFATFRDVDDLKQAEEKMEEQNSLLNCVLNSSPNCLVSYRAVTDITGKIVDFDVLTVNEPAAKAAGRPSSELVGRRWLELYPEMQQNGLFEAYATVVRTKQPFEQIVTMPFGGVYDLTVKASGDGRVVETLVSLDERIRTHQQLERQNKLLEGVLRTSESIIMVYESVKNEAGLLQDFRVVLTNETSARAGRRHYKDVLGHLVKHLNPESRQSGLWEQYVITYETGSTFRGNHYFSNLDKWFDVTINKLDDGLVATFNDITLAQKAAQQIEEQAKLFDGVLDNITNGLTVLEAIRDDSGQVIDMEYVRVSKSVCVDTGRSEADLINSTLKSQFPRVAETVFWPAYLAALKTGEPQRFEANYQLNGRDNYTDNWVTRLDKNRVISVYSTINEQKKAENQARQQAELVRSVLDSCQIAIALFDAVRDSSGTIVDFRYLLQNEANSQMVNYPLAEIYTRTMLEVLPNLKSAGFFARYVQTVETGQPQRFERYLSDGLVDGWFDISAVKQGDGIVVSANNQTLFRQTLLRTEQLVNDLQRSNTSLEQFAYVASHDLQEPLRKIQSFGDLLLKQYADLLPDDGHDMLRRMQSAAGRMSILIRDLLAFSRLSTQQEPVGSVDLQKIVTDVITDLELTIIETNAQVSVGTLPKLVGNPLQLQQLFQNLISNALKFIKPETTPQIHITSQAVESSEVPDSVPDRKHRSWVAIAVTDNGIGFEPQYRERIFQLFERLHGRSDNRISSPAGTGIGLAICRKVAENHGGTIVAHSQPNQGATFTVYLYNQSVSE